MPGSGVPDMEHGAAFVLRVADEGVAADGDIHGGAEGKQVVVGAPLTGRGEGGHDEVGLLFPQAFVVDAEGALFVRREVEDEHVAPVDHALEEVDALGVEQVEGDVVLAAPVVPVRLENLAHGRLGAAEVALHVGAAVRLDPRHRRAHVAEAGADLRPRPDLREVDDADAFEREGHMVPPERSFSRSDDERPRRPPKT